MWLCGGTASSRQGLCHRVRQEQQRWLPFDRSAQMRGTDEAHSLGRRVSIFRLPLPADGYFLVQPPNNCTDEAVSQALSPLALSFGALPFDRFTHFCPTYKPIDQYRGQKSKRYRKHVNPLPDKSNRHCDCPDRRKENDSYPHERIVITASTCIHVLQRVDHSTPSVSRSLTTLSPAGLSPRSRSSRWY